MSTAPTNPRLRLTRRGRGVITALVATPLVVVAIAIALNSGGAFASGPDAGGVTGTLKTELVSFSYITVSAGESLWDVAESIAPSRDPRDVVMDIVSLNQLHSDSVQAGQRLALPNNY